jgi:hypothetical protein
MITAPGRSPNPKRDKQDFWVEEEKMKRFHVPTGILDFGYFDGSAIKNASSSLDSFSPRTF